MPASSTKPSTSTTGRGVSQVFDAASQVVITIRASEAAAWRCVHATWIQLDVPSTEMAIVGKALARKLWMPDPPG